ncbi:MAG: CapA family protein, partial [Oscillospiraceae bacterium]
MSNRSRRHSLRRFWISAMVLCVVVGLTAAISLALRPTTLPDGARSSTPNMPNSSLPSPDVSTLPDTPPAAATVRLMATGDNLIHDSIYQQANRAAGGNGFDFHSVYAHIEGLIAKADLAYLAQETIVAERLYPLSGYPRFNSPEAMGKHMVQIGFNVVGIANNHMFDMGEKGLVAALDFWQEQNVPVFGAWRTEADMHKPIITEKNGVKIAWVPMTEHTNGLALPADTAMRYLLTSERELIKEQIAQARQNADFVIVVPHWGTEYSLDANSNQIELAQCFADLGADLVLGGHSHTLQPMEWRMSAS